MEIFLEGINISVRTKQRSRIKTSLYCFGDSFVNQGYYKSIHSYKIHHSSSKHYVFEVRISFSYPKLMYECHVVGHFCLCIVLNVPFCFVLITVGDIRFHSPNIGSCLLVFMINYTKLVPKNDNRSDQNYT